MPTTATLEQLSRALDQAGALIDGIRPEQSHLPTPCTEFDLRALVNHLVYDLNAFARMLNGAPRGSPDVDLIGNDWSGAYRSAADNLLATWNEHGTEGTLKLQIGEVPASWPIGQHLADVAVHAWDIARATGQPTTHLDPELASVALEWVQENLKPQFRGQAFGPEVPVPETAPIYDRLAGFSGRDPGWAGGL